MDIDFDFTRQVVVENMGDVVNVEAARGDVGGHQDLNLIVAKAIQHPLARFLSEIAVEGFGGKALPGKRGGQFGGADARARENQAALHVFVFENAGERGDFIGRAHEIIALLDGHAR